MVHLEGWSSGLRGVSAPWTGGTGNGRPSSLAKPLPCSTYQLMQLALDMGFATKVPRTVDASSDSRTRPPNARSDAGIARTGALAICRCKAQE